MGDFFSNKKETVNSGDAIANEAWGMGKGTYETLNKLGQGLATDVFANPAYNGQRVAGLNQFQTSSANNLGSFANNTANLGYGLMNTGLGSLGASSAAGGNAADIYGRSMMDPTQSIISQAGQYANNPYVDGLIDASGRDVARQLNEQQLPSLARAASGAGNTNSSRAGVESAIMQRGAQDRLADISSGIRSQFFGTGLGMAQNQYNQNLQNMLGANSQLLNAGQFGAGLVGAGQDFATNAFQQGQGAGGVYQTQDQNVLNAQKDQFNESLGNRLAALQGVGNVFQTGAAFKGGEQTSTTRERNSGANIVGNLLGSFF